MLIAGGTESLRLLTGALAGSERQHSERDRYAARASAKCRAFGAVCEVNKTVASEWATSRVHSGVFFKKVRTPLGQKSSEDCVVTHGSRALGFAAVLQPEGWARHDRSFMFFPKPVPMLC